MSLAETFLLLLLLVLLLSGTALLIHGFIELLRDFGLFQRPRHSDQEILKGSRRYSVGDTTPKLWTRVTSAHILAVCFEDRRRSFACFNHDWE